MLKSNWSSGSAALFGARVIRQRVGRAPRAKSQTVHKFMSCAERQALCQRLERRG